MTAIATTVNSAMPIGSVALVRLLGGSTLAGVPVPRYNLYASIEDLELYSVRPFATTDLVLQSGMSTEARQAVKPSSVLSVGSTIAGFIARGVPSLAAIAGPMSWTMQLAASAFRSYGYSRPVVPPKYVAAIEPIMGNVDVPYPAAVVAPTATCATVVDGSLGYTNVDEMSIAYVASRYSIVFRGTWTTSTTVGSVLYGAPLCPTNLWYRNPAAKAGLGSLPPPKSLANGTTISKTCILPSNVMFLAQMFRYWRGKLRFRITIGANALHSGKIMLACVPLGTASTSTPDNTVEVPAISGGAIDPTGTMIIADLAKSHTFEMDCDFVYTKPWASVWDAVGSFTITVDQPLLAPVTVNPNVDFMVEVMSPDIEFNFPCGVTFPSYAPATPSEIYTQCGIVHQSGITDANTQCAGHKIVSLKQLIQMPFYEMWDCNTKLATGFSSVRSRVVIPPWHYVPRVQYAGTTKTAFTLDPRHFSTPGAIAACYNYVRGATDIGGFTAPTVGFQEPYVAGVNPASSAADRVNYINSPISSGAQNFGRFLRFPVMAPTARYNPAAGPAGYRWAFGSPDANGVFTTMARPTSSSPNWTQNPTWPAILANFPVPSITSQRIGVAAGDDAYCAQFLGPVPLLIVPDNPAPTTGGSYDPYLDVNSVGIPVVTGLAAFAAPAPAPPPPSSAGDLAVRRPSKVLPPNIVSPMSGEPLDPTPHPESPSATRLRRTLPTLSSILS